MPVIRKPNFADITSDIKIDDFNIRVGNEGNNATNKIIKLGEYLEDIGKYTDNTVTDSLLCERDTHVLTSCQCCVLPCEKGSNLEFYPQLFNYQSQNEDPAVLVILVSKGGTSTQIVERANKPLYFNNAGKGHYYNVKRLQDYREEKTGKPQEKVNSFEEMTTDEKMENVIMMFQVPLKRQDIRYCTIDKPEEDDDDMGFDLFGAVPKSIKKKHGMDMGMLNTGSYAEDFIGTKNLKLVRDERFPIRCTFQYYRVTDQDTIDEKDIQDISEQIKKAELVAANVGSLVWSTLKDKDDRITEPTLTQQGATDNSGQKFGVNLVEKFEPIINTDPWKTTGQTVTSFA